MEKKEYYLLVVEEPLEESYHSLYTTYEDALRDFYMQVGRIMCDVIETKSSFLKDDLDGDGGEAYLTYLYDKIKSSEYEVGPEMNYFFFEDTEIYIKKLEVKKN